MSYYRQQLEDFLKTLDIKADTVFDVGGEQGHAKGRVKSWDVTNYDILDLPDCDIQTYGKPSWLAKRRDKADVIFCLEAFEYLINPLAAINNIRFLLKPGGRAFITFAFAYPHHNELDRDVLRYTEIGVRKLVKTAHMSIVNITYRTDRSGLLQAFYASDGMHPSKEYNHHNATGFIVEVIK